MAATDTLGQLARAWMRHGSADVSDLRSLQSSLDHRVRSVRAVCRARSKHLPDARASFIVAGAEALPRRDDGFDVAVSGLVLNFLPDPERPGGHSRAPASRWHGRGVRLGLREGMEFLRLFWDEAGALDPRAAALDEGKRFPLCAAPALASLFRAGGLAQVETRALEIPTDFPTFADYWMPFLRGTGPAPSYVASLDPDDRGC